MKRKKKRDPVSYKLRSYRSFIAAEGLVSSTVQVKETDLVILASKDVSNTVHELVLRYRSQLENYGKRRPEFFTALVPIAADELAPPIVKKMISASRAAYVGPMAAVAGAMAEFVGRDLLALGEREVVVENGGDIFIKRDKECIVSIFAGESPLSNKIGIKIPQDRMPLGVCTSSGTVGHSLSMGRADSVTVLAASTPLADAVATRLGNEVKEMGKFDEALGVAKEIQGVTGVLIVQDMHIGAWGDVELLKLG